MAVCARTAWRPADDSKPKKTAIVCFKLLEYAQEFAAEIHSEFFTVSAFQSQCNGFKWLAHLPYYEPLCSQMQCQSQKFANRKNAGFNLYRHN
jgi:hypothetical protein